MAGEETQADVVEVLVTKVAITPLRRISSDAGNKDRKMDFKLEVIQDTRGGWRMRMGEREVGTDWAGYVVYTRTQPQLSALGSHGATTRAVNLIDIHTGTRERDEARRKIRVARLSGRMYKIGHTQLIHAVKGPFFTGKNCFM